MFSSFSFFGGEEKGGGKYKEDKKDHFKDLKEHFEDKKKAKLKGKAKDEYDDDYDKKGDYAEGYGKEKIKGFVKEKEYGPEKYADDYALKPVAKGKQIILNYQTYYHLNPIQLLTRKNQSMPPKSTQLQRERLTLLLPMTTVRQNLKVTIKTMTITRKNLKITRRKRF